MTQTQLRNGLRAIEEMFERAREQKRAAFLPYFPIGYPDYETSLNAIAAMADSGVDGFEIGIPFSDPLADGTTMQRVSFEALQAGTTPALCIDFARRMRERQPTLPMVLMSYLNPVLAYGVDKFAADVASAGADGVILVDLPVEESAPYHKALAAHGLPPGGAADQCFARA